MGEEYTWAGEENLDKTIAKLFSEPFGQGYPKSEAKRKLEDTKLLKRIRYNSQVSMIKLLNTLEKPLLDKVLRKKDVVEYIIENGKDGEIKSFLKGIR